MPNWREKLVAEVQAKVADGTITSWWQYPDVLEPYDDHDGFVEGWEGAAVVVADAGDQGLARGQRPTRRRRLATRSTQTTMSRPRPDMRIPRRRLRVETPPAW